MSAIKLRILQAFAFGSLLLASAGSPSPSTNQTVHPNRNTMSAPAVTLGYVILYVKDVAASLTFYEQAFGLARRFYNDDHGKAYGELETGAARLAFASLDLVKEHLKPEAVAAAVHEGAIGGEIALVTTDVAALFTRAVKAGATPLSEPAAKPWGQIVAYLRDNTGHIVELCTPLP